MNNSFTVPSYRAVAGARYSAFGQRLQLQPDLSFVNEMRLLEGVALSAIFCFGGASANTCALLTVPPGMDLRTLPD